jgi:hypothetical protein
MGIPFFMGVNRLADGVLTHSYLAPRLKKE